MADSNHTFLQVGRRWLNMSLVTDVEVRDEGLVIRFAAPMARRVGEDGEAVTDGLRLILKDPEERAAVEKWFLYNDV